MEIMEKKMGTTILGVQGCLGGFRVQDIEGGPNKLSVSKPLPGRSCTGGSQN